MKKDGRKKENCNSISNGRRVIELKVELNYNIAVILLNE